MSRRINTTLTLATAVTVGLVAVGCADRSDTAEAAAEDFPTQDITLYTPTDAGGATDLTARTIASQMEESLDVSVVVQNRGGGAGSVGMEHVAQQDADGYTIAVFPVEVAMLGHLDYDIDPADYDFLGQVNSQPGTIAVPTDSPYETLEDLIEAARENPGGISISNAGAGSIWEAGANELANAADVEFQGVPYDGGAPAVSAAIAGQVDAVVAGIGETSPAHADGRLRVLAVFTEEQAPALEDVPTATEQGYDVVIGSWAVIAAPTGLNEEVAAFLESSIEEAVSSEEYTEFIESGGNIPLYKNSEEATAFVQEEADRFAELLGD
ncbi:Bug family tripartite tricarboxylate transporter substrate binding protein [Nesterenkonia flava]|uniref:Tripartite tricarboxylate transporter substrate binding protein n=1 Tax=Nesterenkonia flava TaxID=469799 RepID=A0ABU1FWY4_9MICC|nr:tripartite tricarboxylate transporter substrate binding protein [Nesterenkonia flava]MDR5712661.1 tripartite tricarboxylate transporter substrate binding protein [Nesterenkonia flava]